MCGDCKASETTQNITVKKFHIVPYYFSHKPKCQDGRCVRGAERTREIC